MSEEQNNSEVNELEVRQKRAHLQGWLNQQIVGGGISAEDAKANFDKNDALTTNFPKLRQQSSAVPVLKELSGSEAATCESPALLMTAALYIARRYNSTGNFR